MVLIHTDFPDPVVPAINKWGIEKRSPIIGIPEILFPKAIGSFISLLLNLSFEIISLRNTFSLFELGISIPMVFFPGIVATLVETELVFLAISSAKLIIFETFIPEAGSNSFNVTTGPQLTLLILPSTPKSSNIFSKNSEFLVNSASLIFFLFFKSEFFSKKFRTGNLKLLSIFLYFISLFEEKGKNGCFCLVSVSAELLNSV